MGQRQASRLSSLTQPSINYIFVLYDDGGSEWSYIIVQWNTVPSPPCLSEKDWLYLWKGSKNLQNGGLIPCGQTAAWISSPCPLSLTPLYCAFPCKSGTRFRKESRGGRGRGCRGLTFLIQVSASAFEVLVTCSSALWLPTYSVYIVLLVCYQPGKSSHCQ